MNKFTSLALALSAFVALGATTASADATACKPVAGAKMKSVDDVTTAAMALGYQVRRVKTEDGCYEVYAIDKAGKKVEVFFHPATLKVVRIKAIS